MDTISGHIENIIFSQPDNGFTVAKLKGKEKDLITIVGYLPSLQPGENIECKGEWKAHTKFGMQFSIKEYEVKQPCDVIGIQKYLESGLIKGIGPVYAKKIVNTFGKDTLDIIDENPNRLGEIEGIGTKKIKLIKESWEEHRSIRQVMIFLRSNGITPAYAQKIYRVYGDECIEKVKNNPYQLARDIFGIGFKMADQIASNLGIQTDSPIRIEAGIEYVLWELTNEGHTCYPVEEFYPKAEAILVIDKALIEKSLEVLIEKKWIKKSSIENIAHISLSLMHNYEQGIAQEIHRLTGAQLSFRSILVDNAVDWIEERLGIKLAAQQKQATKLGLSKKMHIITGGPGTGKSTITNAILQITEKVTDKILLAAPTGRAAKRLSQISRKKAHTIHSLLEYDFGSGGFKKDKNNPLKCDMIIIDEASMIDTSLMFYLLKAIPDHTRVIFIGDIDQLPSVGPGSVLKDLIESNILPVTILTEIFRQAKGSQIIVNAHKINQGEFPFLQTDSWSDFHFHSIEDPEQIQEKILTLVEKELPEKKKFHPIDDIQVLSPMRKGPLGIELLNNLLQQRLNPSSTPFYRAGKKLHVHDKVMQTKNNYNKHVYNGDVGKITFINLEEQMVGICFDNKELEYDFSELDEITLAYAVSIHKYQGSECPCIIIPMHTSHFKLLYRNLLYTGVTRGKRFVALVGSKKAVAIAVKNDSIQKRYTNLKQALMQDYQLKFSDSLLNS